MMKYCLLTLLCPPLAATVALAACDVATDLTLGGPAANTLHGTHTIRKGTLAMAKPDGVTAIAGNIVLGGGTDQAILRWDANHQVADGASLTLQGPFPARLRLDGHSETLGALVLLGDGDLALGDASALVRFADSSPQPWTAGKRFTILDWSGSPTGGGSEAIFFGTSADGLTPGQLAQVSFLNPDGFVPGSYPAAILATGELVPATASAYDSWAGAGGKGLTGAAAAFDADPDHDGIPNGIEFVIGGEPNPNHPACNSTALLPTAARVGNNLVFTYARSHQATYLNPVVEFDANLQGPWTTAVDPGNAAISVTPGSLADTVTVTIPRGSNEKLFVRLRVSAP